MTNVPRALTVSAILACWALVGCHSGPPGGIGEAPPPPPPAGTPTTQTYDFTHTVVTPAKRKGGALYTVAILRFGDTREVEDQPFGRSKPDKDPTTQVGTQVNVTVGDAAAEPDTPIGSRPQMNKRAREALKHELVQSKAFTVVERERILEIMREINFGKSRYVDPNTAPDEGKLLAVRYLIEGSLGPNEDKTLKNALGARSYKDVEDVDPAFLDNLFKPNPAARKRRYEDMARMRVQKLERDRKRREFNVACYLSAYQVHTGQVVCSVMGLGSNGLEAIQDAVEELIDQMPEQVGAELRVAAVSGEKVYLDVGKRGGVKAGSRYKVLHMGKPIRDRHGQIIGYKETDAGEVEVTEVRELLSVAKVVRKAGAIARGDVAKPIKP